MIARYIDAMRWERWNVFAASYDRFHRAKAIWEQRTGKNYYENMISGDATARLEVQAIERELPTCSTPTS